MADEKLITSTDLAWAREQEFVEIFSESIKKLTEALGITKSEVIRRGIKEVYDGLKK